MLFNDIKFIQGVAEYNVRRGENTMNWGESCRWAKSIGYKISRKDEIFYWSKLEDPKKSGQSKNLFLAVKEIYNDFTDNKWVDHQKNFIPKEA